jgi:hypothetical protein
MPDPRNDTKQHENSRWAHESQAKWGYYLIGFRVVGGLFVLEDLL